MLRALPRLKKRCSPPANCTLFVCFLPPVLHVFVYLWGDTVIVLRNDNYPRLLSFPLRFAVLLASTITWLSAGASSTSSSLSSIHCLGLNAPSREMEHKPVSAQHSWICNRDLQEQTSTRTKEPFLLNSPHQHMEEKWMLQSPARQFHIQQSISAYADSAQCYAGRCLKLQNASLDWISLPHCGSAVEQQCLCRPTEKCSCSL